MGLDPLRRAEQPLLFAVPGAEEDRPFRLPSLRQELSEGARLLEKGRHGADGILGPVDPRIVVISVQKPLIGPGGAFDTGDDVVSRHDSPIERHLEAHLRRPGANVVGQRQGASPCGRRDGSLQRLEREQGARPRKRSGGRDLRQGRTSPVETLRAGQSGTRAWTVPWIDGMSATLLAGLPVRPVRPAR